MASKRVATSDLNHRNWNEEEIPESSGTFKRAADEVLQKRVIKTAKRRNPISSTGESGTKSAFGSFAGFNKSSGSSSTTFAFLNNMTTAKTDTSNMNGVSNTPSFFTQPSNVSDSSALKTSENEPSHKDKDDEYYAKLKGLNESVSNWIKKHVDTNPLINLKPIFKDYERYFDELEGGRSTTNSTGASSKPIDESTVFKKELNAFVFKSTNDTKKDEKESEKPPQSSFNKNASVKDDTNKTTTVPPTFKFKSDPATTSSSSLFSFGCATTTTNSTGTGFSFGATSGTPFAFTNVAQQQPQTNTEEKTEDQDDEEPPKVEFTPVVEEGHMYSVKCKVFVKNQEGFKDRGVGTLYLKEVPDSGKTQLIVRADTNLGNLLCNLILSQGIPTKRMGKKDVMLICVPTPESNPPPVATLLRVKSPEQADELLAALEKHKK